MLFIMLRTHRFAFQASTAKVMDTAEDEKKKVATWHVCVKCSV